MPFFFTTTTLTIIYLLQPNLPLLPWARETQVIRSGCELLNLSERKITLLSENNPVDLGEEGPGQVLSVPGKSNSHLETKMLDLEKTIGSET